MKGAAQQWIVGSVVAGVAFAMVGSAAFAVEVTDADRIFKNYTRETATVAPQQFRIEVQGILQVSNGSTKVDLLGFRTPPNADQLSGGIFNLIASYGVTKGVEVGFVIPGYYQSLTFNGAAPTENAGDVGDFLMYGKFERNIAENLNAGAGMELTTPNGPVQKGFGTGSLGINPFVSTRYTSGRWALGMHLGYNFYTHDTPGVLNYGTEGIFKVSDSWDIRCEWLGTVYTQGGERIWPAYFYPGIDYYLAENLVLRPTGIANGSKDALSWGLGFGMAYAF